MEEDGGKCLSFLKFKVSKFVITQVERFRVNMLQSSYFDLYFFGELVLLLLKQRDQSSSCLQQVIQRHAQEPFKTDGLNLCCLVL